MKVRRGQTRGSDGMVFLRDTDKLSEAAGVCIRTWIISYWRAETTAHLVLLHVTIQLKYNPEFGKRRFSWIPFFLSGGQNKP